MQPLLSHLVSSSFTMLTIIIIRCSLSDTPVFLPVKSPTVPFRLVVFELAQDIQVKMIRLTMMMIIKNDDDDDY